ncbi:MAG: zinc ribbon domain-containing protein [Magnetococcales bacterium]|nr:zinc ribbon domain-containing protein [Magnetococcales bacterium]
MPLYDYKCDACQHRFEESHSMSDPAITVCPVCQKEQVRKILSTGGILSSSKGGQDFSPPSSPCGAGACGGGVCPMP